ncbi:HSF-type DNA-binding protein [Nitzschia inconspicua]|uniref:HSF-type DNA-binding protein n=1 Tax=Nitzschia inconspicua TaxID=303405 RepID=A0A9K3KRT9_9STRA|nr:HSF-type DNA-binding protein [Nitzschia inconspicua]
MCNPNSSIANRRFRSVALKNGGATGFLAQKLVGSLMTVTPTLGNSKKDIYHQGTHSSIETSKSRYDDPFDLEYVPSQGATTNGFANDRSPSSYSYSLPPTSGYFQEDMERPQQPEFETTPVPVREKPKTKRKRAPQKPGLTAKNQERHFVQHHYHDHSMDPEGHDYTSDDASHSRRRGGVAVSFPNKLHSVLEQVEMDGFAHVISWQPHGRCFCIHKPKEFTNVVMPRYFRQTKLTSFQRQLNLYGFQRLTSGPDSGGYYHELFLRYKAFLCKRMVRTKVKGTKFKAASSPEQEPNFYIMAPVTVTPQNSDCDHSENDDSSAGHDSQSNAISDPKMLEFRDFHPPHHPFEHPTPLEYAHVQPQQAPVSPMVNKLAMQIFGSEPLEVPSPRRIGSQMVFDSPIHENMASNYVSPPMPAAAPSIPLAHTNQYLEQAVDELFVEDAQAADELMDFVSAWDEGFEMGPVSNDLELGNLLDKILED